MQSTFLLYVDCLAVDNHDKVDALFLHTTCRGVIMPDNHTPTLRKNRYFVLDTNVLLHDNNSLFAFKGVIVVIPFVVLEELDTFKRETDERGRNARAVIRDLDELRQRGSLSDGVTLNHETGSLLKVMFTPQDQIDSRLKDTVDNQVLRIVQHLAAQNNTVTLVSKDINVRVKANALSIDAEDYTKGKIEPETFYRGWRRVAMPAKQLKDLKVTQLLELTKDQELCHHEFIIAESERNPDNYRLFRFIGGKQFKEVFDPKLTWDFSARNVEQLMALDLLLDDDVKMLSLIGSAGTGKTFLTLLIGLEKVASERTYRKFLISRPLVALGSDIGYLPGDMQEKLHNWMMPIHDNLEFIFSAQTDKGPLKKKVDKKSRKHHRPRREERGSHLSDVERLQKQGIISIEAITYMRGRSIPFQFIFIDEVQNLTPHEVKTIVSRVGEGSKIILAGDPYQIDSPYLDFTTNGLTVCTEKFKNQPLFGTVFLEHSERSELSQLAADIL